MCVNNHTNKMQSKHRKKWQLKINIITYYLIIIDSFFNFKISLYASVLDITLVFTLNA